MIQRHGIEMELLSRSPSTAARALVASNVLTAASLALTPTSHYLVITAIPAMKGISTVHACQSDSGMVEAWDRHDESERTLERSAEESSRTARQVGSNGWLPWQQQPRDARSTPRGDPNRARRVVPRDSTPLAPSVRTIEHQLRC